MGRPKKVAAPVGPTRRGFFTRSGSAAVAIAALPVLPLGRAAAAAPVFQHGVASGDPLDDRVILWTRVTPAGTPGSVTVNYVVATDPNLTQVVVSGVAKTNPSRDYTVKVDAAGLQAGTTYYYRFTALNETSPIGRTRTLPRGDVSRVRFAVVSCSNYAAGYFNAYGRIAQRADLDAVIHLGDYLYEYGAGQYGSLRTPDPATEMVTLSDYRRRHAQYKGDADSQAMHRQFPLIAIWDDHEVTNDSWQNGAENHHPGTEGEWSVRLANALQAYYEWMPVRPVDVNNRRKNYRGYAYGNLVDLLLLEERVGSRSQQIPGSIATPFGNAFSQAQPGYADPARQLLGAEQESWLFGRLRNSSAAWRLLGQGVMFAQLKVPGQATPNSVNAGGLFLNPDQWDGYQPARDRVYAAIKGGNGQPPVDNVVVLTGDIHSSWAADLSQDPNNPDLATGGYDPATGAGSHAVEFVGTSVSSPGIDSDTNGSIAALLRGSNPHFKYINLHRRGYMVLDVTPKRALCEWWHVDTVAAPSSGESFAVAFQADSGSNRLSPATQTTPPADAPPLAP